MPHDPTAALQRIAKPIPSDWPRLPRALCRLLSVAVGAFLGAGVLWDGVPPAMADEPPVQPVATEDLTLAAERALALLEAASAGSAEQRTCFTCHSQAHPVLAIVEARRRGFRIDDANLARQVRHTAEHLNRGRQDYLEGRGQGGKSDTAGYALWTLRAGGFNDQTTTGPVVTWLLAQQREAGNWQRSSDRPPSEASHFATTYVALKAIRDFATDEELTVAGQKGSNEPAALPGQPGYSEPSAAASGNAAPVASESADERESIEPGAEASESDQPSVDQPPAVEAQTRTPELPGPAVEPIRRAREWLIKTAAADTEDRVFRLLSLRLVEAPDASLAGAARDLLDSQRDDGGWAQTDSLDSDAYATGTALFALHQTGQLAVDAPAYLRGLAFLVKSQQADGSWHVTSRSRPFQTYYETGFPHGKDQFISTSATAWATLAILLALPEKPAPQP